MPPNLRGGKAYRKGKKAPVVTEEEKAGKFSAKDDGQEYGRVLKMLGERRVLCFCNDGVDRVCKIRGKICKGRHREWIEVGDIVLLSFREFEGEESGDEALRAPAPLTAAAAADTASAPTASALAHASGRKEIADLVGTVPRVHWGKMRKLGGIHRNLFIGGGGAAGAGVDEEDIFAETKDEKGEKDDDGSDLDIDAI